MTNYRSGHDAEQVAADYLRSKGYAVRDINWRTRYCEIDIVAEKHRVLYFVEVKSRRTGQQGSGLDYILPRKLRQMSFAAELWVAHNKWDGAYQLSALSIDAGQISFIESLT
ncbi:hypothetical protein CR970_02195 [Candidatus Saccharibacteria bacterium]|nr:MAG: hypothetical protein CR970_02195 [Candidatus Saccharibacteria bacterium]